MGCGGSKANEAREGGGTDTFINGKPSEEFPYDELRKCTERDNGLLFRLTNSQTKQWAFYNDSKVFEFHVTVTFSTRCRVEALGSTSLVTDPNDNRAVANVIVGPCMTEPFVQGDVDGFDAEYQAVMLTPELKEKIKAAKKAAKKASKAQTDDDLEGQRE
ncbi:calpain-like cysteine peptidase [Trypanosoma grayi]|uniref:calpain-like cysteine peptidase n=1 Tax=Trypanosoma grayi TaxID=71804 RepID=UPI0004F4B70D|nr:calpain-like cysteine peptidase [Trypanosoma grayi]KEG10394.1 calpain-like cysteine peptidase [Trypanosoma grayi]